MQINIVWDSSTSSAPAAFKAAVNYVVQYFDQLFTNPITITIDVGWGEIDGQRMSRNALGESETNGDYYSYSQVRSALTSTATSADQIQAASTLSTFDPTNGGAFFVASAEEKALGLLGPNAPGIDGYAGFASNAPWNFATTNTAVTGQYYFVGVVEHEFTEDMGRIAGLDPVNGYTPMDLYRYQAANVRDLTGSPSTGRSYFSIDGGKTDLGDWNQIPGGDPGDWAADMAPDALLAYSSSGVVNGFSAVDIRLMNVLGYNLASVSPPPPNTYSLSPNPASVNENAGTLSFTVTRTNTTAAGTVYVSTVQDQGYTNTNGQYYGNLNAQPVSFAAGQATATVSLSIKDLGLSSGSETFRAVVLQNASDPVSAAVASDLFTIVNTDAAASFSISPNPAAINENAGSYAFTVSRSTTVGPATIYLSTEQDQGYSNTGGQYYTDLNAQPVSFASGQASATVSLSIKDLGLTAGSETFRVVALQNATDPASAAVASDVFTINNTDGTTTYSLSPNPASINENAGSYNFTVTRSNGSGAATVYVSTEQDQGFTNTSGQYYTDISGQAVNFAAGQTTANVSLAVHDLGLHSGSETFRLIVQYSPTDPTSAALASDAFTIVNNDPTTAYAIAPNPASVSETAGKLTFTITRGNTSSAQTLYATTVNDQNYLDRGYYVALTNVPVTFAVGQSTATVSIAITNVGLKTGSEKFRLVVTQKSTDPVSAAVASDVFTIVNTPTGGATAADSLIPDFSGYLRTGSSALRASNSGAGTPAPLHKEELTATPSLASPEGSSLASLGNSVKSRTVAHFGASS